MRLRQKIVPIMFLSIFLMGFTSITFAKEKNDKAHSKSHGKSDRQNVDIGTDVFIGNEYDSIRQYFRKNYDGLPPGLKKRGGDLPPGLEKQLRQKGHLPPGLEKKVQPFPVELEETLPPLKPGLIRGVIEGRAIIFNSNTKLILDIFSIF